MSIFHTNSLVGASGQGGGGYSISRSLRFNSADSAFLSRTPASAGNRKTWTWSGWVKRTSFGSYQALMMNTDGSDRNGLYFNFDNSDRLAVGDYVTTFSWALETTQVFRDPSAWFHIVLLFDSTKSTSSDRVKLYINGSQVTALATASYPTLNYDGFVNTTSPIAIGRLGRTNSWFLNGYLADIHFIDGQALDPTSFGEFSATTGVWMPKRYTGTYGTNGFKLDFSDNSAATATTLGKDSSGNGNNWTPNNLSVTAGAGNDSLVDVPTNGSEVDTGSGGQVRGNYCTWNPLDIGSSISLSNGNLDGSTSLGWRSARSTFGITSGKWYWELTANGSQLIPGLMKTSASLTSYVGADANGWSYYGANGNKINNGSQVSYGSTYGANDVIGVAFDADVGTLVFYKNNVSQGTAYTGLTSGPYFPAVGLDSTSSGCSANFGQRPFAYTAPSGFKALCTANLPAPTIVKPSTVMDVKLYTGNGSTQTISGLGFSPDLVWLKGRSGSYFHGLWDQVRGTGKYLGSNTNSMESGNSTDLLSAFNSDGFSVNTTYLGAANETTNGNSTTYVAWAWDAGSSTVTNTAGTISAQVRANASGGFSIVTFTANGTAGATVGHGLGVAPSFVIVKGRTSTANWLVYHAAIGNTNFLQLNTTIASTSSVTAWNNASPSSSVFTLGNSAAGNTSGAATVAYCFAPVAGYSAFGSYTGNGNADGPFVYTGHRSRWIMIKASSGGSAGSTNWIIIDTARDTYNLSVYKLAPNLNDAENSINIGNTTQNTMDILSNGFKLRSTTANTNESGTTYVWASFAENPFSLARAR